MRSTRRLSGGLGLAVVSAALFVGPWLGVALGEEAAEVSAVAWFSDRPGASAQPDGGFEVADTLDGTSTAAVQLTINATSLSSLTLVLDETVGVAAEQANVRACLFTGTIGPANPGALDAAPAPDCTGEVLLERDEAGDWSGNVLGLAQAAPEGAPFGIALLPGELDSPVPLPTGFSLTFEAASVLATGSFDAPTTTTTFGSGGAPAEPAAPLPVVPPPVTSDPNLVNTFDGQQPLTPPTQPGTPEPDSEAVSEQTAEENALPVPTGSAIGGGGDERPWWRLVLLIPFSAGIGYAAGPLRTWFDERFGGDDPPLDLPAVS